MVDRIWCQNVSSFYPGLPTGRTSKLKIGHILREDAKFFFFFAFIDEKRVVKKILLNFCG